MDDATQILVARAQASDSEATGVLFERYGKRMRRALTRMITNTANHAFPMDADDLLQDAILSALRTIETFEYRGEGSFQAWLLQTAKHQLLNRIRAARTQKRSAQHMTWSRAGDQPGLDATPSQVAMGRELEERVQRCIEAMPDRERTALMLARYLDYSAADIQRQMELSSAGAARALLSRAQARLARMLDEIDPESNPIP